MTRILYGPGIAGLSGRFDKVIFASLRGTPYLRRPTVITAPATPAQAAHRYALNRTALVYRALAYYFPLVWLYQQGLLDIPAYTLWVTANFAAFKHLTATCLTPAYPPYETIYNVVITTDAPGKIRFEWEVGEVTEDDRVMIRIRKLNQWGYSYKPGASASQGFQTASGLDPGALYDAHILPHYIPGDFVGESFDALCAAGS